MPKKLYWFFILLAALAGLAFWGQRIMTEQSHKNVEVVIDYPSAAKLRDILGINPDEFWARLKAAGITGVAFPENSLEDLQLSGQARVSYPRAYDGPSGFVVELLDSGYPLGDFLSLTLGKARVSRTNSGPKTFYRVADAESPQLLRGLGFDPVKIYPFPKSGFDVYLRPESRDTFGPADLDSYFTFLDRYPKIKGVIFNGEKVLGYPGQLSALSQKLKERNLLIGSIEAFNPDFRQKGLDELSLQNPQGVIRVGSFAEPYQNKLTPRGLAAKFALGVKERNLRLVYFRPYFINFEGRDLWEVNNEFLRALKTNLEASGYRLASSESFPPLEAPLAVVILVVLGVICGSILLLEEFFPENSWELLIFIGLCLIFGGVYYKNPLLARQLFAFLAAVVFPTLALAVVRRSYLNLRVHSWLGIGIKSTGLLLKAVLISFFGAVFLSSLLTDGAGMLGIPQMRAIKLSLVLPFLLLGLLYLKNGFPEKVGVNEFLDTPVKIWQVLLGVLVLGVGAVLVFRSGNVGSEYVSDYELNLRGMLSGLLGVRPRFKEFLIGYPALFLLPFAFTRGWKTFSVILWFAGLIGLVSMVNSFAHIHTPLLITLQRMGNGLFAGIPVGILLTFCLLTGSRK